MVQSVNLGPTVIAVCASMTVAAAIFLGLRLYCKITRGRTFWWDDHVLIAAWTSLAIATGLAVYIVTLGFGKEIEDVDPANVPTIILTATILSLFAVFAAAWSKTSFALTLIRLVDSWMKKLLWTVVVAMNIVMNLVIIFSFVKCTPVGKVWDSSIPGTCWDPYVTTYYNIFAGAFSGLIDVLLCILSWFIIWKLSMRTREKIGIGIALTFGIFAAVTAAVKCVKMVDLGSPNRTYAGVGIIMWGITECAVTIMAASIPVMRMLFLNTRPHLRRSDLDRRRGSLRKLNFITMRSKKPSVTMTTPSDGTPAGGIISERGDVENNRIPFTRTESDIRDEVNDDWVRHQHTDNGIMGEEYELQELGSSATHVQRRY
ncbi:hypothetical protein AUP68_07352 [Ilyonectria robusta]